MVLMLLLLLVPSACGFHMPPEWSEVIQSLCAEANNLVPPPNVQIYYGRHAAQMQVSY